MFSLVLLLVLFIWLLVLIVVFWHLTIDSYSIEHIFNIVLFLHLEILDITSRVYCFLWIITYIIFSDFNNLNFKYNASWLQSFRCSVMVFDLLSISLSYDWFILVTIFLWSTEYTIYSIKSSTIISSKNVEPSCAIFITW